MPYNSVKIALNEYLRVIKLQLLIGLLAVIIVLIFNKNLLSVISAFCGLAIAVIPTVIYVKLAWSNKVINSEQIFARHKKAELFKFILTILAFVLVFVCFKKVHILALFTTYVATLSSYWFCLFFQNKSKG